MKKRNLARCYDLMLVLVGPSEIIEIDRTAPKPAGGRRTKHPLPDGVDLSALEVHPCDGCSNYGPRGLPPGTGSLFQQYALVHGSLAWKGDRAGWYCMGCSYPPR